MSNQHEPSHTTGMPGPDPETPSNYTARLHQAVSREMLQNPATFQQEPAVAAASEVNVTPRDQAQEMNLPQPRNRHAVRAQNPQPPAQTVHEPAAAVDRWPDATTFIKDLPRVQTEDLANDPEDVACSICKIKFGEEDPVTCYVEFAVRLPCGHVAGKACISRWLSRGPDGSNANSCIMCRRQFFDPWPAVRRVPAASQQTNQSPFRIMSENARIVNLVRSVERAGYVIGPYLGYLQTEAARDIAVRQYAANRRLTALRERDLYVSLAERGDFLMDPTVDHPEVLDIIQDIQLFRWLETHGAFLSLPLCEDWRVEKEGPTKGRLRGDAELYETLRDRGIYFALANNSTGRWRTEERFLYSEEQENETTRFHQLLAQGALDAPQLHQAFPNTNIYEKYRGIVSLRLRWDPVQRQWSREAQATWIRTQRTGEGRQFQRRIAERRQAVREHWQVLQDNPSQWAWDRGEAQDAFPGQHLQQNTRTLSSAESSSNLQATGQVLHNVHANTPYPRIPNVHTVEQSILARYPDSTAISQRENLMRTGSIYGHGMTNTAPREDTRQQ